jgi:hypothetical protein
MWQIYSLENHNLFVIFDQLYTSAYLAVTTSLGTLTIDDTKSPMMAHNALATMVFVV